MVLSLPEFQREQFQGYIENLPSARVRILDRFMPTKPIFGIKFGYDVITKTLPRTASITGFNAGAPLRDKAGFDKAFGEVAKVQHGFKLDEEELLRFNQPRNDAEQAMAVDYVYDQTDELVEGIRDIEEWMRSQPLYTGKLAYNENGVILDIDYSVPTPNKLALTGTDLFSDKVNSKPLDKITAHLETYKSANQQRLPVELHMSGTMVNDLLQNAQIKGQIYGSPTDARIVTRDQLQALFQALGIPRFVIQDDVINMGAGDTRLLPARRIAFLGDGLGNLYQGITRENNYKPGMYVVPEIKETNPPMEAVYVGETVFPALVKPQAVAWIDA